MKALSTMVVSIVLAGASTTDADEPASQTGKGHQPWRMQSGYRVLSLAEAPIVIDEPGRYALDRDWNVDLPGPGEVMDVVANDVTIDFRGFAIASGTEGSVVHVSGDHVSLSNGSLVGDIDVTGLVSTGARTTIDNMQVRAWEAADLKGADATVRDSSLVGRFATRLGEHAVADHSTFGCSISGDVCLRLTNAALVTGNRIGRGGDGSIVIAGDGNILADNILDADAGGNQIPPVRLLLVEGDGNVLRSNTVLLESSTPSTVFVIDGTRNVVDGNISVARAAERGGVGIVFARDGNFYGDNRFGGALEPTRLNGTVQTDWGGNVCY